MLQVKTYKLMGAFGRMRNDEHCCFYGNLTLKMLEDRLAMIPFLSMIYAVFQAMVAREEALVRKAAGRDSSVKEWRGEVDRGFEVLATALNAAYIMNETGAMNPAVRTALEEAITIINAAVAEAMRRRA